MMAVQVWAAIIRFVFHDKRVAQHYSAGAPAVSSRSSANLHPTAPDFFVLGGHRGG